MPSAVVTINYATRNFKLILPEEHLANHMFHQKMLNEASHKQVSGNEEYEPLAKLLLKKKNDLEAFTTTLAKTPPYPTRESQTQIFKHPSFQLHET